MKKLFFTSNTKHYHKVNNTKEANEIDNINRIIDQISGMLESKDTILFIAASPDDYETVDFYSKLIFDGFKLSGIEFKKYLVLDRRTFELAREYVSKANLIFLSGGDAYVENEFFVNIQLKEILNNYNGIIVGQSAGSINLAKNVYNSPEEGISTDERTIYFEGLGLSHINIEPHFVLKTNGFNANELYQRNHILNESKKRPIYALCDGSHILETDDDIVSYGESYIIKDGIISPLCNAKETYLISTNKEIRKI